jgi:urease beta subunit
MMITIRGVTNVGDLQLIITTHFHLAYTEVHLELQCDFVETK